MLVKALIYVHAILGGLALIFGAFALSSTKGGKSHKRYGKFFYYCLLASIIISLVVALLPETYNPFLFSIGIFSIYLLLGGRKALSYKQKNYQFKMDKVFSLVMMATSLAMILMPLITHGSFNVVLLVFGVIGLLFSVRDLMGYKKPEYFKKNYLKIHIAKMTGSYIASVTAFFVVNDLLPNLANWFFPSVVGTLYIIFWTRKVSYKKGL